ncbi:MAG: PucR family transcriptional regulator [Lachnospiraceae bacterium]
MIECRDILKLNLDGVELIAGESGLDRMVSWTYVVMTRPFQEHMNHGNFSLCVVDFERYDFEEAALAMEELNELGISGFAISVKDNREPIPEKLCRLADKLQLPLFSIRWENATFVDITQSIGNLILESNVRNKRKGDFLYNLLFGYDINEAYIEKISEQFDLDFSNPHRVGIIVVDRIYGENLDQDEHFYDYYMNCLREEVANIQGRPMYMNFLNKFVVLFQAYPDKSIEHEFEKLLQNLDRRKEFAGKIKGTCILGNPYRDPAKFALSYQEAKCMIAKKDILPNPKKKKVISMGQLGVYKFLFRSGNQMEVLEHCNQKLRKLEEYDNANGTFLIDTILAYYLNGFNLSKTADYLYVHRNTLHYRFSKITELLGFEMDDYMEYLELVNCILIKQMMFS